MGRLENRTNATEQALTVASNILGGDQPYAPVPYYWIDQFEAKIQMSADAEVSVAEGSVAGRRFVLRYQREGATVAVLGWNMPKQLRAYQQEIAAQAAEAA